MENSIKGGRGVRRGSVSEKTRWKSVVTINSAIISLSLHMMSDCINKLFHNVQCFGSILKLFKVFEGPFLAHDYLG